MKNCLLTLVLFFTGQVTFGQVPKKVVVEHFTNTKCSVCAARNPGFYSNLNSQSDVIHLAVHPSSPYSTCVLSQHNTAENDARTNHYGVYGSTPRLVIQGVVISGGADYSAASLFAPYLGQTAPASIRIVQLKFGSDSIRSTIIIKTEALHTLGALNLFVALAEDTINYTGSNGEPVHYDVFRKSLGGATGVSVILPPVVGDSVVYTMSSPVNAVWNFSRIFTLAILQETLSKAVVQSESVSASENAYSGISESGAGDTGISVFAYGDGLVVNQKEFSAKRTISVYDIFGRVLFQKELTSDTETITLTELSGGVYLYVVASGSVLVKSGKFVME